jgi:uncharacterized protein (DUF2384 family)
VPTWARHLAPRTVAGSRVGTLRRLPDLTIVRVRGLSSALENHEFLRTLASKHAATPSPAKVLIVFKSAGRTPDAKRLLELFQYFSRPADVELAEGSSQAPFALEEACAKLLVSQRQNSRREPSADPLGELSAIVAATADLRAPSGRLSAKRIAGRFGMSVAELARALGKSRQTVTKTDDAEAIQEGLAPFARIARLRAVLSEEDFRAWLNLPHEALEGRRPLTLIRERRADVVADLATDMLSGSPD